MGLLSKSVGVLFWGAMGAAAGFVAPIIYGLYLQWSSPLEGTSGASAMFLILFTVPLGAWLGASHGAKRGTSEGQDGPLDSRFRDR